MSPMWGIVLGLCAALSFSVGLLLQKRAACELPAVGRSSLRAFLRSPRWLSGNAFVGLGWAFQFGGLAIAPVAVVMPTVATGLIFQALLAHLWLHERWSGFELAGVLACVVGLVLLSSSIDADSEHAGRAWSGLALASLLAAFVALALIAAYAARRRPAQRGAWLAAASGLLYAGTGLLTKVLGIAVVGAHEVSTTITVVALMLAFGAAALVLAQSAYQSGRAVVVLPMMCCLADFLPTVLSPLAFDERWPDGPAGMLRGSAVAAILCGVLLLGGGSARWRAAVDAVTEAEPGVR